MNFHNSKRSTSTQSNPWQIYGENEPQIGIAAFSKDGRRLLTVRDEGVAEVFDLPYNTLLSRIHPKSPLEGNREFFDPFRVFIESADLNHDGSLALLGLNDLTAGVFRVYDGKRIGFLALEESKHQPGVLRAVRFSHDGKFLAVGFYNRTVLVWDGEGKTLLASLTPKDPQRLYASAVVRDTMVSSLAFSFDNTCLFAGHSDGTAIVWNLETQQTVFEAYEHIEKIVGISHSNHILRWCTSAGTVWQSTDQEPPIRILQTNENWEEVEFEEGGESFLSRHADHTISLWSIDGTSTILFESHKKSILGWAGDTKTLGFSKDRSVQFFPQTPYQLCLKIKTRQHVIPSEKSLIRIQFSPHDKLIAVERFSDVLELYESSTGKAFGQFASKGGVGAIAFSHDGEMLAIGEIGHGGGRYVRDIRIWSIKTQELLHHLKGHQWQIHALAFTSDNQTLVSLADDMRFWELGSKNMLSKLFSKKYAMCSRVLPLGEDSYATKLVSLATGATLVIHSQCVELWQSSRKRIAYFELPERCRRKWYFDAKEGVLFIEIEDGVSAYDVYTGTLLHKYSLPIQYPETSIPEDLMLPIQPFSCGRLWRAPGGPYLHAGDAPRGWVSPINTSHNGRYVLIPCEKHAVIVDISGSPKCIATFSYSGKLRGACFLENSVLAINSRGKIFTGKGRLLTE